MADHTIAEYTYRERLRQNEIIYLERLRKAGVPEQLHEGLVRYLVHRVPPGSFLLAVLTNDLTRAIARGNDVCLAGLPALVRFLYHDAPAHCWGTPARVAKWLRHDLDLSALDAADLAPPIGSPSAVQS